MPDQRLPVAGLVGVEAQAQTSLLDVPLTPHK
jgi:hypothetical protein